MEGGKNLPDISDISSGGLLLNARKESLTATVLLYALVIFLTAMLIFVSLVSLCKINGTSMENTIYDNRYVLLYKHNKTVKRSDIVVINIIEEDKELIKRIIAVEGDAVLFMKNPQNSALVDLYLNKNGTFFFIKQAEPYIKSAMTAEFFVRHANKVSVCPYVQGIETLDLSVSPLEMSASMLTVYEKVSAYILSVPRGEVFFLGDNRNNSKDSRYYGTQPAEQIYGKYFYALKQNSLLELFLRLIYRERSLIDNN